MLAKQETEDLLRKKSETYYEGLSQPTSARFAIILRTPLAFRIIYIMLNDF